MSSSGNSDPETRFMNAPPGDQQGDYLAWCSIGPWIDVPDGGMVDATVAFAVQTGDYQSMLKWPSDLARYNTEKDKVDPSFTAQDLFDKYPGLFNAFSAEIAFEGVN